MKKEQLIVITNITLEPYWTYEDTTSDSILELQTNFVPYNEYQTVAAIDNLSLIVICLNFDSFYPNLYFDVKENKFTYKDIYDDCIRKCIEIYSYIRHNTKAHIVWFGFEDYFGLQSNVFGNTLLYNGLVDELNLELRDILSYVSFVDMKRVIANIGIANAYEVKGKYRWNAPYSKELISHMVSEVNKQYLIHKGISPKCIVLDCDNVLWGGILSEVGIEGIKLSNNGYGKQYQELQRFLLYMYYSGVIVAICSKNDEEDILKVFREHTGMLLKEHHISCFQCNWENKPQNIRIISEKLNIGLESIIFVDDSVFEIESVKTILPEVKTILYNKSTIYQQLSCFSLKPNTNYEIVLERINTYKTNIIRDELKRKAPTFSEYITSLNMVLDIHITTEHELTRISELTQRTNKCSNGTKYTLEQLKNVFEDTDYSLYTVCLSDRFSDLGIVGAMGVIGTSIDLFSLSCRALGRRIETEMIEYLMTLGIKSVKYVFNDKNRELYQLFALNSIEII